MTVVFDLSSRTVSHLPEKNIMITALGVKGKQMVLIATAYWPAAHLISFTTIFAPLLQALCSVNFTRAKMTLKVSYESNW